MANRRFPSCTHCGGHNEGSDRSLTYYANDGEIPCYDIKCSACGKHYQVGMFPLPIQASPSALDEDLRERRRNDKRRRFGYTQHGTRPRPQRITSDRLVATIRITRGRVRLPLHLKLLRTGKRTAPGRGKTTEPGTTLEVA